MIRLVGVLGWLVAGLLIGMAPASAQSQAANGSIEGTVRDSSGGVLPGVTVVVTNQDNGFERTTLTNTDGLYRAVLLPLGRYRVVAELSGFQRWEQVGMVLAAGQTAVVSAELSVGGLAETVTVSAEERPVLDAAKIDAGRNLSEIEVRNLPLVARNPYNFALAQPGVTGFENPEFGVPRLSANGTLMRINYQIDGNTNTEKDRVGLRLLPMSEVMIREVKVVTSGYAPEFGQTMGMVYNAITPSGANQMHGDAAYLFRRKSFSSYPFFFNRPRTDENKPDTRVDTFTATLGGPIVRDKLFYYAGFERTRRDLSSTKVITITPANQAALGLDAQPGVPPTIQTVPFLIGKVDYQFDPSHRLTARHILFRNQSPYNNGPGGLNAMDTATDFTDGMDSTSAQLVSTLGSHALNELRLQYAYRHQYSSANEDSGTGPYVSVSGAANFGGPFGSGGAAGLGFDFKQGIGQLVDNVTLMRGNHSYKLGFDVQYVSDTRSTAPQQAYTFATIQAYRDALSGVNRRSYQQFTQILGDLDFSMKSWLYGGFVQDDWQLAPNVKMLYGLRYDLYRYPDGRFDSLFPASQSFNVDTNNFGPRVGLAWTMGPRTVVRASSGLMYDQPVLLAYENALQFNGSPRLVTVTVQPNSAGAPAFPNTLASTPPGFALPTQSIATVDPEFEVARTWQNNVQLERSIGNDYSVGVAYTFSQISQLPVVNDINLINPTGTLADGRPVYNAAVSAGTRADPRFNHVYSVQSIGRGHYNALSLTLARRFSKGTTFNFSYTLAKGVDNAPLSAAFPGTAGLGVVSDSFRTDPTNLDRDEGPNLLDVRHNFNGSIVFNPRVNVGNELLSRVLNGNQLGVLIQLNSGLPINLLGNQDLNRDGFGNDRPVGVGRNSIYLPARYNVDMRYSRFASLPGGRRLEVIGEFKNLFNTVQTQTVNATIVTNALGVPSAAVPTSGSAFAPTGGFEQRQFQLGFRFKF